MTVQKAWGRKVVHNMVVDIWMEYGAGIWLFLEVNYK